MTFLNPKLCNKLSVHYAKKTQFILFIPKAKVKDKPKDFTLLMGGNLIEQTSTYKYLGVIIDENLNWVPQIDKMCAKLASVCGILSKVCHFLDRNALMLIYNSLVESRLRYGILSWSSVPLNQLNRLKVLQNKALRFINFSLIVLCFLFMLILKFSLWVILSPFSKLHICIAIITIYCPRFLTHIAIHQIIRRGRGFQKTTMLFQNPIQRG